MAMKKIWERFTTNLSDQMTRWREATTSLELAGSILYIYH